MGIPQKGSYAPHKSDLVKRLSRIEGQVRGITKMVEGEQYCVDILTQVAAVRSALDRVALKVLDDHVHGCVVPGVGADGEERVTELMDVLERFIALRK